MPTLYLEDWIIEKGNLPSLYHQKDGGCEAQVAKGNIKRAIQAGVQDCVGNGCRESIRTGLNAHELDVYVNPDWHDSAGGFADRHDQRRRFDGVGAQKTGERWNSGKWADMIAVDKNPLEDVRVLQDVKFVMKSGVVYKSGGIATQ